MWITKVSRVVQTSLNRGPGGGKVLSQSLTSSLNHFCSSWEITGGHSISIWPVPHKTGAGGSSGRCTWPVPLKTCAWVSLTTETIQASRMILSKGMGRFFGGKAEVGTPEASNPVDNTPVWVGGYNEHHKMMLNWPQNSPDVAPHVGYTKLSLKI